MTSYLDQPKAFVVTGRGPFPIDMLRHDQCYPADNAAVVDIGLTHEDDRLYNRRSITLIAAKARFITPARWSSFGWVVLQEAD